ncbi:MAG: zinc-binding alcohol dehydrogenase family protein [Saprospiraceae bacterium]|nr:zinc-binding alcohol dehydrogenase family protein [Saprospiraceae bacterium]
MKSILLEKPYHFTYKDIESDESLAPDQVLLKIHNIGICGTDYHAFRGNQPFFSYPRRLGHELGVEIVALGSGVDAEKYPLSSRGSVEPYLHCGVCQACRRGKTNCCESLQVLGVHTEGGMTEFLKVPAAKVHLSKKLTFEQLALVETLAIGCHAVDRAKIEAHDSVLIIGAGPIGLSVVEFARMKTASVFVLDRDENRLTFCRNNYGVQTVLAAEGFDLLSFMPEKPTIIFDATGNEQSMNDTVKTIAHSGKIVFVGLHQGFIQIKDSEFHRKEVTLMASRNALPQDFEFIIQKMEEGVIDTSKWITHRADFDDMLQHFETWLKPESRVIKAVVQL